MTIFIFKLYHEKVSMTNNSNNDIGNTALVLPDDVCDCWGPLVNELGIVPPLAQLGGLHVMHDVRLPAVKYLGPFSPPDLLVPSVGAVALLFGREMLKVVESGS